MRFRQWASNSYFEGVDLMKLKCQFCGVPIWPSGMAEIEIYSELECLENPNKDKTHNFNVWCPK